MYSKNLKTGKEYCKHFKMTNFQSLQNREKTRCYEIQKLYILLTLF